MFGKIRGVHKGAAKPIQIKSSTAQPKEDNPDVEEEEDESEDEEKQTRMEDEEKQIRKEDEEKQTRKEDEEKQISNEDEEKQTRKEDEEKQARKETVQTPVENPSVVEPRPVLNQETIEKQMSDIENPNIGPQMPGVSGCEKVRLNEDDITNSSDSQQRLMGEIKKMPPDLSPKAQASSESTETLPDTSELNTAGEPSEVKDNANRKSKKKRHRDRQRENKEVSDVKLLLFHVEKHSGHHLLNLMVLPAGN